MSRSRFNERGAAMVEGALVISIILLLTFAIIDIGMYSSAYSAIGSSARNGARQISIQATQPASDYEGVQQLRKSFTGFSGADLHSVVVFKASSFKDTTPSACTTSSQAGLCTYYSKSDLDLSEDSFIALTAAGWNPPGRQVSRGSGTDLVGVSVTADINTPIGLFGDGNHRVTKTVVLQLESEIT